MKKIGILFALIILPFICQSKIKIPFISSSTKIEVSVDSFTGETSIMSDWQDVSEKKLWIKLEYKNDKEYIELRYISGEQLNITPDNPLMIQGGNSVSKFSPIETYKSAIGGGAVDGNGEGIWGINAIYEGSLSCFNDEVTAIRISTVEGNKDFKLSKSATKNLKKIYESFLIELEKVKKDN